MSLSRFNRLVTSELKQELYETRSYIIGLMAPEIREKLMSYHGCENWKDLFEWERSVIQFVVERTVLIPKASDSEKRAHCPLCGSGGNSSADGYVIPRGLEFHLNDRSERSCPVMKAAWHLAHDDLKPKLDEADLRANELLASRRKAELVFLVNPFEQPKLIEEGLLSKSPRDWGGLTTAEAQLSILGFALSISGNVKSYKLESNVYLAYADPRQQGQIRIDVYRKPLPKYRTAAKHKTFFMSDWENELDGWDNGLEQRFAKRLMEALRRLKISADGSAAGIGGRKP
jgi:hypothetical protein